MALDMNPEVRAQWCAALRSGEYRQGAGKLTRGDRDCCMGVLVKLAQGAGVPVRRVRHPHGWIEYDGCENWLPPTVQEWAGLENQNPKFTADLGHGTEAVTLSELNDDRDQTFAQIADLIDGGAA